MCIVGAPRHTHHSRRKSHAAGAALQHMGRPAPPSTHRPVGADQHERSTICFAPQPPTQPPSSPAANAQHNTQRQQPRAHKQHSKKTQQPASNHTRRDLPMIGSLLWLVCKHGAYTQPDSQRDTAKPHRSEKPILSTGRAVG